VKRKKCEVNTKYIFEKVPNISIFICMKMLIKTIYCPLIYAFIYIYVRL